MRGGGSKNGVVMARKNVAHDVMLKHVPDDSLTADLVRASRKLMADAQSGYPHKSGRGDHREEILTRFLQERLPATVALTKGHIADSDGRTTSEFDIILYNPLACLMITHGSEKRKVVPVECVQAVIEVRSHLNRAAIVDVSQKMGELSKLKRYYNATALSSLLRVSSAFSVPVDATNRGALSLPIYGNLFGYDGVSANTIRTTLVNESANLENVTKLSGYVVHSISGQWEVLDAGPFALEVFLSGLTSQLLNAYSLATLSAPDVSRYSTMWARKYLGKE